jgi:peptidoglycan/LPS O-acetylase OafA/YrhL
MATASEGRSLSGPFSVYLDFVRFAAAMVVFLSHACKPGIANDLIPNISQQGIDAVSIFFVLSGLVVSYAAQTKDHDLANYTVSRLARLWSVAVPAIVLSALLFYIGKTVNPGLYAGLAVNAPDDFMGIGIVQHAVEASDTLRAAISMLFVNELWGFSIIQFGDPPYWSLGYEFWYYVLFGLFFYLTGWKRTVAVAAAALLVGPKIMLLMPVWLMGVLLYHFRPVLPRWLAFICLLGPIVAYALFRYLDIWRLLASLDALVPFTTSGSADFARSYVVGIMTAINFIGFNSLCNGRKPGRLKPPITWLAAKTLSLYLFHFPILYVLAAFWPIGPHPAIRGMTIILVTLATVFLLSLVSEAQKNRWRTVLATLFSPSPIGLAARRAG